MINVLVPITERVEEFKEFVEKHKHDAGVRFYVGINEKLVEKLGQLDGVEVHVYEDEANREEIINGLHTIKLKKGKLMLVRRPLSEKEFYDLKNSEADIATLKSHHNKFSAFCRRVMRSLLRAVFAFTYFEDISAISYGENLFELMSNIPNLSMATRVNRYVGVDFEAFETNKKTAKRIYDGLMNGVWLALAIMFFVTSIFDGVLVFVINDHVLFVFGALIALWWIIALTILLAAILKFSRTIAIGDLNYETAKEKAALNVYEEEKEPKTSTTKKPEKKKTKAVAALKKEKKTTQKKTTSKTKKAEQPKEETSKTVKTANKTAKKQPKPAEKKKETSKLKVAEKKTSEKETGAKPAQKAKTTKTVAKKPKTAATKKQSSSKSRKTTKKNEEKK